MAHIRSPHLSEFQAMQTYLFPPEIQPNQSWFEALQRGFEFSAGSGWPDRFGKQMRIWFKGQPIRTLSLFSGGGGLDIAFHDAGFQIQHAVEIESAFARTLQQNSGHGRWFPSTTVHNVDVCDFTLDEEIDFIIGGPPCQTFSAAGLRQGTDDPRGRLFEEYVRLLKSLRPRGFLFENVYGILGTQRGEVWCQIQEAFRAAGYVLHWRVLDAADYGVPQHRERVFIVGLRDDLANTDFLFPYPCHGPDSPGQQPYYTAGQATEGVDTSHMKLGINGRHGHLLDDIPPGLNYSFYTQKMKHPRPVFGWRSKFSYYLYKADPNRPVRTIVAQPGNHTGPFSWKNRLFSLGELKRLQTFPDDYQIHGGRGVTLKQIGNSVPPQVGRLLALAIRDQLYQTPLPIQIPYMSPRHPLYFRQRKRALTTEYRECAAQAIRHQRKQGRFTCLND